jgi:hypothetical protein
VNVLAGVLAGKEVRLELREGQLADLKAKAAPPTFSATAKPSNNRAARALVYSTNVSRSARAASRAAGRFCCFTPLTVRQ